MTGPTDGVKPPDLHTHVVTVCTSRPRRCERVEMPVCRSCDWRGEIEDDAPQLDLFAPPVQAHTAEECRRRQTDPWFRYDQDSARLAASGLPGILQTPKIPRPDPEGPTS